MLSECSLSSLKINSGLFARTERVKMPKIASNKPKVAILREQRLLAGSAEFSNFTKVKVLLKLISGKIQTVSKLANLFDVADLTKEHLVSALALEAKDFEDALQYYCACSNECEIIVTRNKKDFAFSKVEVLTPEEFCKRPKITSCEKWEI